MIYDLAFGAARADGSAAPRAVHTLHRTLYHSIDGCSSTDSSSSRPKRFNNIYITYTRIFSANEHVIILINKAHSQL